MSYPRIATLLVVLGSCLISRMTRAEVLIDFQPSQTNGSSSQSLCNCYFNEANAVLHWSCEAFTHSHPSHTRTDASLSAIVIGGAGSVSVAPTSVNAQTHYSTGNEAANVAMTMGGTGTVNVMISVAIDTNTAVAGTHDTTVHLTVTSL